jgi:hypothetical protein
MGGGGEEQRWGGEKGRLRAGGGGEERRWEGGVKSQDGWGTGEMNIC